MPIVNGSYYMNGEYGQGLEQNRIADAFRASRTKPALVRGRTG